MLLADHVNPRVVKWRQRRAPSWLWGPDNNLKRSVYLAGHRLTVSGIFSRLLAVGCTGKACFGLAVGCTGKARFGLAVDCTGKARF